MPARDLDLTHAIYDAVLDPRGLVALADLLQDSFEGSAALGHEVDDGRIATWVSRAIPRRVLELYETRYHAVNPLLPAALEWARPNHIVRLENTISLDEFHASEFFVDFARGAGTAWLLGTVMPITPENVVAINLTRPLGDSDYGDDDRARLQRWVEPMRGALALRRRLGDRHEAGLDSLDALAFAAVVCDGAGRVIVANREAERLAEAAGGFSLATRHGGPITAGRSESNDRLAHLIREASERGGFGAAVVSGADGAPMPLLVTPLPRRFGSAPGRVLVTVRAPDRAPMVEAGTLIRLFGLTRAEADVAVALSAGEAVADIARRSGVGQETVRTHVKRCLAKSGASSQRAFVALLGHLPPVRMEPGASGTGKQ